MGRMGLNNHQKSPPVSNIALSADSRKRIDLKHNSKEYIEDNITLRRGELLGVGKPIWLKVQQSECRLAWLSEMVRKGLIVRNIDAYAKSVSSMLRSEEVRFKEEERNILMGLMKLKLKDEKLNLKNLTREKEKTRQKFISILGKSSQYYTLIRKLRKEVIMKKSRLKKKYKTKLEHLEKERRKEMEEKWKNRDIPKELMEFMG